MNTADEAAVAIGLPEGRERAALPAEGAGLAAPDRGQDLLVGRQGLVGPDLPRDHGDERPEERRRAIGVVEVRWARRASRWPERRRDARVLGLEQRGERRSRAATGPGRDACAGVGEPEVPDRGDDRQSRPGPRRTGPAPRDAGLASGSSRRRAPRASRSRSGAVRRRGCRSAEAPGSRPARPTPAIRPMRVPSPALLANRQEEQGRRDHQQDRGEEVLAGGLGGRGELLEAILFRRKKNSAGSRHPCAWMKKTAKAIRATREHDRRPDQQPARSSSGGRGRRDASEPAGGSEVADHEARSGQQPGDEHPGEGRRDQPPRVDEVLVREVPRGAADEEEQEHRSRTRSAARTRRAFPGAPEPRTGAARRRRQSAGAPIASRPMKPPPRARRRPTRAARTGREGQDPSLPAGAATEVRPCAQPCLAWARGLGRAVTGRGTVLAG